MEFFTVVLLILGMIAGPGDKPDGAGVVYNNKYNGSVVQVVVWLKSNYLNDPDSFQAIEWSKVVKDGDGYMVRCKYRAKNSFGGYAVEEKYFTLDAEGNVIGAY